MNSNTLLGRWASGCLVLVAAGVLCLGNGGCAAGMAMSGQDRKDTSILFPGAPRATVVSKMGPPNKTGVNEQGERTDFFKVVHGNERSSARAAAHGVMDLVTWGAWELIGTPLEMGAGRSKAAWYRVVYDAQDNVKDVEIVEDPTKKKKDADQKKTSSPAPAQTPAQTEAGK